MKRLAPGQRDFLWLSFGSFLLYETFVRYNVIEFILQEIMARKLQRLAAFFLIFSFAVILFAFRRWKEQIRINRRIQQISLLDELTGLYNRRGFLTLSTKRLRSKLDIYLIYADLDNMKWINDQFGHHIGDHALIRTAHLLRESFSKNALIARLGGDEFALLIHGVPRKLVERMIRDFQRNVELFSMNNQRGYYLSVSIGLAHQPPKFPCTLTELMAEADHAMYEQKVKNKEVPQDSNA